MTSEQFRKASEWIEEWVKDPGKFKTKNMRTITLENGKTVKISEESYKALEGAVKEVTWEDIYEKYLIEREDTDLSFNIEIKLAAIRKLLITARHLNADWKPDWEDGQEQKWSIGINEYGIIVRTWTFNENGSFVYFKSESMVKRAISILGEEVVRTALNTDW